MEFEVEKDEKEKVWRGIVKCGNGVWKSKVKQRKEHRWERRNGKYL